MWRSVANVLCLPVNSRVQDIIVSLCVYSWKRWKEGRKDGEKGYNQPSCCFITTTTTTTTYLTRIGWGWWRLFTIGTCHALWYVSADVTIRGGWHSFSHSFNFDCRIRLVLLLRRWHCTVPRQVLKSKVRYLIEHADHLRTVLYWTPSCCICGLWRKGKN